MDEEIQVPLELLQQETEEKEKKKFASETDINDIVSSHFVFPYYISDGEKLFEFIGTTKQARDAKAVRATAWSTERQYRELDIHFFEKRFMEICTHNPEERWKYKSMQRLTFQEKQYKRIVRDLFSDMRFGEEVILPASNSEDGDSIGCLAKLLVDMTVEPAVPIESVNAVDEFLGRMHNSDAFCMRLISSFWPKADRRQMLYLRGEHGGDSKSSFFSAFQRYIGGDIWTLITDKENFSDRFATEDFKNKRFLIMPEIMPGILKHDKIKAFTGEDLLSVTAKYTKKEKAPNHLIVIMHANKQPDVKNDSPILKRLIYCDIAPYTGEPKHNIIDIFHKGMPYFMKKAYEIWLEYGKPMGHIPTDNSRLYECQSPSEDEDVSDFVEQFLEHYFVKNVDGFVTRDEFRRAAYSFTSTQAGNHYKSIVGNNNKYSLIRDEMQRLGFKSIQKNKKRGFSGLSLINREESLEHKQEREAEEITAQVNFNRYEMEMEKIRQQNLKPPKPIDLEAFIEEQLLGKKVH